MAQYLSCLHSVSIPCHSLNCNLWVEFSEGCYCNLEPRDDSLLASDNTGLCLLIFWHSTQCRNVRLRSILCQSMPNIIYRWSRHDTPSPLWVLQALRLRAPHDPQSVHHLRPHRSASARSAKHNDILPTPHLSPGSRSASGCHD